MNKTPAVRFIGFAEDWEQRKLGEVSESYSGGTPSVGVKEYYGGQIPFIRSAEINSEITELSLTEGGLKNSSARLVDVGDILYALYGATSGEVGRARLKGAINQAILAIKPHAGYDSEYLAQWLRKSKHSIIETYLQGGQGNLSGTIVKELSVDFPLLKEQQTIGNFFSQLDHLITFHQRKYEKLKNIKKSMLEKMFPKNGSNVPEIRFKRFTDAWEQRKFSDLVQIERGGSPRPIDDFITDSPDGLNWVKIGDAPAQGNYITKTAEKIKPEGLSKTREVHPGDLILSNSMSFGKPYIMGIDGCIHDGWLLIRNTYKVFDLTFLCHLLGTPQMIIQYKSLAAGSTVNNLNKELVGNTVVTIPTIKEQRVLGQYLETLDNLITLHQRKYDKLTNVKKSMLEKMFPQNGSNAPEIRFKGFTEAWEQRKVREVTDRYDNLRIPVAASLRVAGTTPYYGANGIQDYVDGYTHDGEFILVAEDGANDLKNYPVKCVKGRIWVNNHAHVLQGKYDCADNQFLAYAISQADIESLLVGGGRAKLNAETLMGIDLLLPNKAEQIRIGKYLAQLDNLITLHQRELEKLKNLKKACLEKMFV